MIKFSSNEIRDLFISFFVISLAFTILYSRSDLSDFSTIVKLLPMVMVGVGLGFILHELAHKVIAMRYGYWAEFKTWTPGLFFALISPFLGFIFAAPGAVYIYGDYMSDKENGIISLFGPLTNIILAFIFFLLYFVTLTSTVLGIIQSKWIIEVLITTFILGFSINSFLALFNLLPVSILDGAKIFRWDPLIWLAIFAIAGVMVFLGFTGILF